MTSLSEFAVANHPNRRRPRVQLGASVFAVPEPADIPALVARIARLWAELHEADPALALAVARSLPQMEITRL